VSRAFESARRIGGDQRLDAEPDHFREVVIGRVFAARHQPGRDAPAIRRFDALERGCEIEPYNRRPILASHPGKCVERAPRRGAIFTEQLHGPCADVVVRVPEHFEERVRRPAADDVEGPHRAKPPVGIGLRPEHSPKRVSGLWLQRAIRRAMLENEPRAPRMPVARAGLERHELVVRHGAKVRVAPFPRRGERRLRVDSVDPPRLLVQDVLPADVAVVPVEHVQRTVGAHLEAEADPVRVVGHQEIVSVMGGEPRAPGDEHVRQHRVLVDVRHEDPAALRRREGV
jgi:hypothetical protein